MRNDPLLRRQSAILRPRARRGVVPVAPGRVRVPAPRGGSTSPWLRAQVVNVRRHAAALGPFRREEFLAGRATVSEGHVQATNGLISALRAELMKATDGVARAASDADRSRNSSELRRVLSRKDAAHHWVRTIERVWQFYFELFTQRQTQFGRWLLACDRIALDCYQVAYRGIGTARPIPAPGPFSYMQTGFAPATFRRGIRLRQIGRLPNPFPLIQLPYHRLVNPWTLGAVLHEVSHSLQNDLGLANAIPRAIRRRLLAQGLPSSVAATWMRWNRESFADLCGTLLGGPAIVRSLMDVVGRDPRTTTAYSSRGPHPTPWLRTLLSLELLRRMGFAQEAASLRRTWLRLYPDPRIGNIPRPVLETHSAAIPLVVDTICFTPYRSLGNRSLADAIRFEPKDQAMILQAAKRVAAGTDPGVVPPRFLIAAAREALDRRYARPGVIADRFYAELVER